jgi:hypothetical protein
MPSGVVAEDFVTEEGVRMNAQMRGVTPGEMRIGLPVATFLLATACAFALAFHFVWDAYWANADYWANAGMVVFWRTGLALMFGALVLLAIPPVVAFFRKKGFEYARWRESDHPWSTESSDGDDDSDDE